MKLFSHFLILSVVAFGNEITGNTAGEMSDAVDERGIEKFTLSDFGNENRGKNTNDSQSCKIKFSHFKNFNDIQNLRSLIG